MFLMVQRLRKWISLHQLLAFFILTFGYSWIYWILMAKFAPWMINEPAFYILSGYGPTFAALFLTGFLAGGSGLKLFLKRALNWRVNFIWYFLALFGFALMLIFSRQVHGILYPGIRLAPLRMLQPIYGLIPIFLFGILYGPLGEEFGWRGFALPRLERKLGALFGSLVLGLIWAVWHLPLHLIPELKWAVGNTPLKWFFLLNIPWVVFFSWLYNNTNGSVLLAILLHASLNFSMGILRFTSPKFYPAITIVFWAVALFVVVIFGPKKLSRKDVDLAFYTDEIIEIP